MIRPMHRSMIIAFGLYVGVFALGLTLSSCASAPSSLTPAGVIAFRSTQVVKGLDVLRDFAINANTQLDATGKPLFSTESTRKVVTYHRSIVSAIGVAPSGWMPLAQEGLTQLMSDLPPPERQQLAPYVALVKALIAGVTK